MSHVVSLCLSSRVIDIGRDSSSLFPFEGTMTSWTDKIPFKKTFFNEAKLTPTLKQNDEMVQNVRKACKGSITSIIETLHGTKKNVLGKQDKTDLKVLSKQSEYWRVGEVIAEKLDKINDENEKLYERIQKA